MGQYTGQVYSIEVSSSQQEKDDSTVEKQMDRHKRRNVEG